MFNYFSQVKAKGKIFLFAALVFVFLTAFLAGCSTDPEDDTNHPGKLPDSLVGTWTTIYDSFEINRTEGKETLIYDDGGYFGYEGTIMFVSNYDDRSGVIIIKYSDDENKDKANPFHAVYYLNLKNGVSVELNNSFGPGYSDADTATLDEAINKFTRGQMGNYMNFAMSTEYAKQ